jgi:hypothetical protein
VPVTRETSRERRTNSAPCTGEHDHLGHAVVLPRLRCRGMGGVWEQREWPQPDHGAGRAESSHGRRCTALVEGRSGRLRLPLDLEVS